MGCEHFIELCLVGVSWACLPCPFSVQIRIEDWLFFGVIGGDGGSITLEVDWTYNDQD